MFVWLRTDTKLKIKLAVVAFLVQLSIHPDGFDNLKLKPEAVRLKQVSADNDSSELRFAGFRFCS